MIQSSNINNLIAYNCINNLTFDPNNTGLTRQGISNEWITACAFYAPPNTNLDIVVSIPVAVWASFEIQYGSSDLQTRDISQCFYLIQKNGVNITIANPTCNNTNNTKNG